MKLHELSPQEGSRHKKKRLGRGISAGQGKTSGKGHKGQNARSGGGVRPGFEGGQNPIYRRLPKRGFTNINRKEYALVNLSTLEKFDDGTTITPEFLIDTGVIKDMKSGLKVLGNGDLTKKLNVKADKFSKAASEKIAKLGGSTEVL